MYWDVDPTIFTLPYLNLPVRWYGLLFGLGFFLGIPLFSSLLRKFFHEYSKQSPLEIHKKAAVLTDRFVLYMLIGTILGARVGHLLFYEHPSRYWGNFKEIIAVWEGGLASHGAVFGIFLAIALFRYRIKKQEPHLTWIRLLDFVSIPTALCGFFIRVGNFINQEITGTPSSLPWAVTFGHPMDHSLSLPRHPVQLYEAFAYLLIFLILWRLSFAPRVFKKEGALIGLFFVLVFGARFVLEWFKLEQSDVWGGCLTMGQLLSLPMIGLGFWFLVKKKI